MYSYTFKLTQHTPIIHFEGDQAGATLRATEVKPKLDRFILSRMGNGNYDNGYKIAKDKEWLVGSGDKPALDYKLQINTNNSKISIFEIETNDRKNAPPMFFGNMGEEYAKNIKYYSFCNEQIVNKISSLFNDLLKHISNEITSFFLLNNFGTRQSKGYGSFTISGHDNNSLSKDHFKFSHSFIIRATSWTEVLLKVNLFYRSLRSGINEVKHKEYSKASNPKAHARIETTSDFYLKPAIFLYAKSKGHQWDKKSIKQRYLNTDQIRKGNYKEKKANRYSIEEPGLDSQKMRHSNPDILSFNQVEGKKYDYKDLFGLSSSERWMSYDKTFKKSNGKIDGGRKLVYKNENANVQRFRSPLIFKPVKLNENTYQVILIFEDINQNYVGETFFVDFREPSFRSLVLEIPDFSFKAFFNFISEQYDLDELIHEDFRDYYNGNNMNIYDVLKEFYDQLKR